MLCVYKTGREGCEGEIPGAGEGSPGHEGLRRPRVAAACGAARDGGSDSGRAAPEKQGLKPGASSMDFVLRSEQEASLPVV